jgi:hypothetical protein
VKIFLRGAISIAAIAQFLLFAAFLNLTMILRPFSDMISYIDDYLHFHQNGDLLGYLWAAHTEHHQPFIRVLTALDVAAFRASGVPFVVASSIATIVAALLIYVEFRRDEQLSGPARPLSWLAPMLLLTTGAAVDCSIPINSIYPLSLVFLVATLVLFDSGPDVHYTKRTAALVIAIMASFTNVGGLAIWPALLWLAWRRGASKRWLIGIATLGVGYGSFYVLTLPSTGIDRPSHVIELAHLLKMADYLLAYLGLPLSRQPELGFMARGLGGVLLLGGLIAIIRDAILRGPTTRLYRFGIGLIMIALGIAFLVALGRVDIEQEVKVPVRYAVFVAPLHIGLLAVALPHLAQLATRSKRQIALLGAGATLAAILLVLQVAAGRSAIIVSTSIANAIARFEETGLVEPGWEQLYPDVGQAKRVLTELNNGPK